MVLNLLTKSSKACVQQIMRDDSAKSALWCLVPDEAALFNLLTTKDFNVDGTPGLNEFTTKLIESSQGPGEVH